MDVAALFFCAWPCPICRLCIMKYELVGPFMQDDLKSNYSSFLLQLLSVHTTCPFEKAVRLPCAASMKIEKRSPEKRTSSPASVPEERLSLRHLDNAFGVLIWTWWSLGYRANFQLSGRTLFPSTAFSLDTTHSSMYSGTSLL